MDLPRNIAIWQQAADLTKQRYLSARPADPIEFSEGAIVYVPNLLREYVFQTCEQFGFDQTGDIEQLYDMTAGLIGYLDTVETGRKAQARIWNESAARSMPFEV